MRQAADAIVTGFTKSRPLMERSLAPLRRLRQDGVLRHVYCVTWDGPETDAYAQAIETMPDVTLVRVPQPSANGTPNQRGVVYQVHNLKAALALIPDADDLVLKLRPDFVANPAFLMEKIVTFDAYAAIPRKSSVLGIAMPKPVLHSKIWIPWADSNQPFFYEDAAFLGRKRDVRRLVTKLTPDDMETLGDPSCGSFAHAVRYARIFLGDYPMFARYMREYRYFVNDYDYRVKLVAHMLNNTFFWHLVVAHAWCLRSHFHVDAGEQGDLCFYSNTANPNADWSKPETLQLANPYGHVDEWRETTRPDEGTCSVRRVYGRLVDDAWQTGLFANDFADFPRATLVSLLKNLAGYRDGRLREMESGFYKGLAAFHHSCWAEQARKAG